MKQHKSFPASSGTPTCSIFLQLLSVMDCCFNINIPFCLMKYYFFGVFFLIKLSLIIKSSLPIYFFSHFPHLYKTTEGWLAFLIQNTSIMLEARLIYLFSVKLKSTGVIFGILMESLSDIQIIVEQCLSKSLCSGKQLAKTLDI